MEGLSNQYKVLYNSVGLIKGVELHYYSYKDGKSYQQMICQRPQQTTKYEEHSPKITMPALVVST
jgi:hypothetical protein